VWLVKGASIAGLRLSFSSSKAAKDWPSHLAITGAFQGAGEGRRHAGRAISGARARYDGICGRPAAQAWVGRWLEKVRQPARGPLYDKIKGFADHGRGYCEKKLTDLKAAEA